MLSIQDFEKKQIIFVFAKDGEKISLQNGNLIVTDADGKVKIQVSCFRLFMIGIVGHISITTAILQESKKYGFYFALFTTSFRLYSIIGADKDGNTILKQKQYSYNNFELAKLIIKNKIATEYHCLKEQREKSDYTKETIETLKKYYFEIDKVNERGTLLAYEGLSSKMYFKSHFNNLLWQGRQPRLKRDYINSTLDIGYTVLFSFIESILQCYGFDVYKGVLHTDFYLRKSLVCDIIEPFRFIIDKTVKKGYNLREIKEDDFTIINHQYQLNWKNSTKYVSLFMKSILENKTLIFQYIQKYYRCFMKDFEIDKYPFLIEGEIKDGSYKL